MKTYADEPINKDETGGNSGSIGLTKREYMAIEFTKACMIGIISGSGMNAHNWAPSDFAENGLMQADALITELNKEKNELSST